MFSILYVTEYTMVELLGEGGLIHETSTLYLNIIMAICEITKIKDPLLYCPVPRLHHPIITIIFLLTEKWRLQFN